MHKIIRRFFILAILLLSTVGIQAQEHTEGAARSAYDQGHFNEALLIYNELYEAGSFSEDMLYRMSYIHERQGDFGYAVYYLKKISEYFGGEKLDEKIRQLMVDAGAVRGFSGGSWTGFIRFFNDHGWWIWLLFILGALGTSGLWIWPKRKEKRWAGAVMTICIIFFIGAGGFVAVRSLLIPNRAVVVQPTSFYTGPGYGTEAVEDGPALGETVSILGETDIWLKCSIGEDAWWVPKFVVKSL